MLFLASLLFGLLPQQGPAYRDLDRAAVEAYRRQDFASARQCWQRCLADPELQSSRAEKGRVL